VTPARVGGGSLSQATTGHVVKACPSILLTMAWPYLRLTQPKVTVYRQSFRRGVLCMREPVTVSRFWLIGVIITTVLLAGCTPAAVPPTKPVVTVSPAPDKLPKVTAIHVTGPGFDQRYTAQTTSQVLSTPGPLQLRVELAENDPTAQVNWYFQGDLNHVPGPVSRSTRASWFDVGQEITWNPGPLTVGRFWVEVSPLNAPQGGHAVWSSFTVEVLYPLPQTTQCPAFQLPPPPINPGHAWRSQSVSKWANSFTLTWVDQDFLLPLSTNPDTCADPNLAAQLREAKSLK
jgi:hypothetical protein